MSQLIRILSLTLCCLMLTACDGPFIFMAGGALSGTISEVPASWQLDKESALAQLETRPDDPYSINLAYVQLDGEFYFYAGDIRTNWVKHIEQNPHVRIRVGEMIYPGHAVRVTSDHEISGFADIWVTGSMFQRDPRNFEEVWLYRLEAR